MKINILYLVILQIIDFILIDIFQIGFINSGLCYIPLLSFVGFMLITNDIKLEKALIYAIVFGLIQDFIMYNTIFELVFIYVLLTFVSHYWSRYLNDNFSSSMVLSLVLIFLREVLVYVLRYYGEIFSFSFGYFVIHRLFIVLFFNIILVAFVILLNSFRIRFIIRNEYKKRLSEDLFGSRISKGGE